MSVFVFTGPTLQAAEARAHLDAVYLPPAAQGDVYRVARERPRAIGVIDGYFDTLPAVWHKETLWALREGIAVFGAGSMGALRAAELAAFGMRGVGEVFEAFHQGELEDDDEVTLAHEPESAGYRALSVPMVNVRATLAAAVAAGVVGEETRQRLVSRAKELFYPERSYRRLVAEGNAAGLRAEMDRLAAWLPEGQIDAKREDALAMLRAIRDHLASPDEPAPVRFHFEHTTFWEALTQTCDEARAPTDAPATGSQWRDVLDELRLLPGELERTRARALNRALSRTHGERQGQKVDGERLARMAADLRRDRRLFDADAFRGWLAERDLDERDWARLVEDEALLRWTLSAGDLERRIVDEAKLSDAYPALRSRALHKESVLARAGLSEPGVADTGMSREELLAWYFRTVTGEPVPEDLPRHVRDAGFTDEQLFLRVALRELLYRKLAPGRPSRPRSVESPSD